MTLSAKALARIAASVAAAPPLTPEQIAELRRIFRPDERLFPLMERLDRPAEPASLSRAA